MRIPKGFIELHGAQVPEPILIRACEIISVSRGWRADQAQIVDMPETQEEMFKLLKEAAENARTPKPDAEWCTIVKLHHGDNWNVLEELDVVLERIAEVEGDREPVHGQVVNSAQASIAGRRSNKAL
jgi:hypothetical protein